MPNMAFRQLLGTFLCCLTVAMPDVGTAAPDKTLGMALMSAVVDYHGQLVRGSGVTSVSNPSTGRYVVSFNRDITDCTWVVNPQSEGSFAHGDFGPNNSYAANQLLVAIEAITAATSSSVSFNAEPDDFNLIVFCPQ